MPLGMLDDVWGSTLGDLTHKGQRQAGNKSMLTYNSSNGIPGYTGFIPGPHSIPLPIKCFEHTGRPVDPQTKDATIKATLDKTAHSEYTVSYHKKPCDTVLNTRTGGGYWIKNSPLTQTAPFEATTTYRAETLDAANTAAAQLERSLGLRCTLPQYEAARLTAPRAQSAEAFLTRRSQSAPRTATQRPATAMTSTGKLVGYQSTVADMIVHNPLVGGPAAPGAVRAPPPERTQPEETRYQTMPRAMPPGMYGAHSSYIRDHGIDTSDPMERSAPSERFQTRCVTSRELSAGTTRTTNNPPGYTGHIAASKYNRLAQAQSAAADDRLDLKADMLLYNLDQYSRGRLPHYTGHKPHAAKNITVQQPSQGPPKNTTTGAAALQATRFGLPEQDHTHHSNSRAGVMTFFSSTGETVSDNGLSNAQAYYGITKDMGTKFKYSHFPHHTHYGKPFNPRNSLV